MGRTESLKLKKVKSSNVKGYNWVMRKKFIRKNAIPRIVLTKNVKKVIRSKVSRSLDSL